MSDAHQEHQSVIRTPKQLIVAIIAAFVVPILIIVLLVKYVSSANQVGAGSDNQTPAAIAARLQPVSDQGFVLKDVNAPKVLQAGGDVYKAVCAACHDTGAVGAPKTGDPAGWTARIAQGYDTLVSHAINGIRAMPPKGGNADLDDLEVASAVVFMANKSGGKFKEPAQPAPASTATAAEAGISVPGTVPGPAPVTAAAAAASASAAAATPSAGPAAVGTPAAGSPAATGTPAAGTPAAGTPTAAGTSNGTASGSTAKTPSAAAPTGVPNTR